MPARRYHKWAMAIFNPFLPSFTRSPYRAYAALRAEEPVHFSPTLQAWVVTSYAECERILRDHARFSSSPLHATGPVAEMIRQQRRELPLGAVPTVLNSDPPVHTRLRGIVSTAFTPRVVEGLRARIVAIAESLLDEVPEHGEFDLVPTLMQPLPVIVIAELLGVPPEDRALFKQWSNAIAATTNLFPTADTFAAVKQATTELIAYLTTFVEARQREPQDDLLTALVQAEDAGGRLSRAELLAFCVLLLVAGHETTTNLIGNGVLALLGAPEGAEALDALRADPALIPNAVEEFLRYDSPVQAIPRVATEQVTLGEGAEARTIEPGAFVLLLIGAANRDPARFPEPDRFDIRREDVRHLSFGLGSHFCLGAPLARLEAHVVFDVLLRRFPSLQSGGEPERGGTFVLRGLQRLPVSG